MPTPPINSRLPIPSVLVGVFVLLLILKLLEYLSWSWWWITLPLWLMPAIYILTALMVIGYDTVHGSQDANQTSP